MLLASSLGWVERERGGERERIVQPLALLMHEGEGLQGGKRDGEGERVLAISTSAHLALLSQR